MIFMTPKKVEVILLLLGESFSTLNFAKKVPWHELCLDPIQKASTQYLFVFLQVIKAGINQISIFKPISVKVIKFPLIT